MKKIILLVASLFVGNAVSAQNVDAMAKTASSFVGGKNVSPVSVQESVGCFNVEGGGFVVVSELEDAPVLGYSTKGSIDVENVPPAFRAWLKDMALGVSSRVKVHQLSSPKDQIDKVDPLLTSEWSQSGNGYNSFTPGDNMWSHPTVGCGALAMGQVMRYWRYPQHGMGTTIYSHQGQYPCWTYDTLTVNYEDYQYDWDLMPDALDYSSSQEEREAVGRLLYHCGVSLKMLYNIDCNGSSGAEEFSQITALREVFGYNSDARQVRRADTDAISWTEMLRNEISSGRPVLFAGYCNDEDGNLYAGHAFVIDGYNADGFFHVNWGWGGYYDGYYAITMLDPMDGMSFTSSQTAIVGLDTNQGHSPVLRLASDLVFADNHIDTTGHIQGRYLLTNSGDARFDGFVGLAVYDTLTEDDHYHRFYRYIDTREVHLAVGDTLAIDIDRHEYLEVGRYHFCLHFGENDFSSDDTEDRSQRMFDACYEFERRMLVDNPITVSVADNNAPAPKVYPNPASRYLVVKAEMGNEIVITDMKGHVVLCQKAASDSTRLDVSAFSKGMYLLKVGNWTERLVID